MTITPCPICSAPGGFHEENCGTGPLPTHLSHLARRPASRIRQERPRGKPSDAEIARRRAAKFVSGIAS